MKKKTFTRYIRVNLTDQELLQAGKDNAEKQQEIKRTEEELKRVTKDFQAKLAAYKTDASVLADKITTGYEMRNVECYAVMDDPKKGRKTIRVVETQHSVTVEDMTDQDMQAEMDMDR